MLTIGKKLVAASLLLAPVLMASTSFAGEGSAKLLDVTRKSGGAHYRVIIAPQISLDRISIDVLSAKAKIHRVSIVTEREAEFQLMKLQDTAVIPAGKSISSEYISRNERIAMINIQAESYGAVANLRLRAVSSDGVPQLITVPPSDSQPAPRPPNNPPPRYEPEPTPPPRYEPEPTPPPVPTPTPPEVVYLDYPFSHRGVAKITCAAQDKGWEEHFGGHNSCESCKAKHGTCIEKCTATDVVVYGTGFDVYGRIAKFEGRGGDRYEARDNMRRVCDYYRLSRCESDSGKSDSTNSEVISRRSCN